MLNSIAEILNEFEKNLDREYDTEQILMLLKIKNSISELKNDLNILFSVIPKDINPEIIKSLKKI